MAPIPVCTETETEKPRRVRRRKRRKKPKPPPTKVCSACLQSKLLKEFYGPYKRKPKPGEVDKGKSKWSAFYSKQCRDCYKKLHRPQNKAYMDEHRSQQAAYYKQWAKNNHDQRLQYWRERNKRLKKRESKDESQ